MQVPVQIFVKPDIYASVENVQFGLINLEQFKTNRSVRDLLVQTVILNSRIENMKIAEIDTSLPFLKVELQGSPTGNVYRLDFSLDSKTLTKGKFSDNIVIRTNIANVPTVSLPVSGEIR